MSGLLTVVVMLTLGLGGDQSGQGADARPAGATAPIRPETLGANARDPNAPVLQQRVDPTYTEKALRAGIEGEVWLSVSVRADGTVGSVLVEKSLDTMFGLDQQAIAAVKRWLYAPMSISGRAVFPPTHVVVPFHLPAGTAAPRPVPTQANEEFGKGAHRPGEVGLKPPKIKTNVAPAYTIAGLRAKIQGVVRIEAVVLPDGTVGQARIMQSLDANTGLDDQALGAARVWTFEPATLQGQPVPIIVQFQLEYRLH